MRRLCRSIVALGLLVGGTSAANEALREPPPPRAAQEKDFRTFLSWFEGEFDSSEQVAFADELGIPKDAVPERIHSVFKRVELPAFGEHVFYVEQYLGELQPAAVACGGRAGRVRGRRAATTSPPRA